MKAMYWIGAAYFSFLIMAIAMGSLEATTQVQDQLTASPPSFAVFADKLYVMDERQQMAVFHLHEGKLHHIEQVVDVPGTVARWKQDRVNLKAAINKSRAYGKERMRDSDQ